LRFYSIALASLREVQAIIDVEHERLGGLEEQADILGACLYRLVYQA
jgi:hypothetical protein